ncbi:cytokine receptor common subunit gamma [Lates calcarifer]|uniref:Cytokine receptor common subunit gamma n=1 Tax=Lates calcarifer TaxID=8187 RepID=A0A4W6F0B2_LATCA|nr:cytokine receptor common subunit gamma [Lates calcarifer]
MPTRLFLLLFLIGHVFAKEPPDVECVVVHQEHVKCSWNKQGTPQVNYTFYSWFHHDKEISNCTTYMSESSTNIGCIQPYNNNKRFTTFYTRLVHGNKTLHQRHELKNRVLLYPPTSVTVQNGSDFNLWFYWNQSFTNCVESEVRYRINNKKWMTSQIGTGDQNFCINLPSSTAQYELQVRSRLANNCGQSELWSDWSEPAVWGYNNTTVINHPDVSVFKWTPFLYAVGIVTLLLLVIMLLHHERIRIIPIPVVPKPSPVLYDIEDWLRFSKGLKGNFKANYNEHACPVREYCYVSQSDSESSDGSTLSVTTDQTDCSVSIPVSDSDNLFTPCSSSTSDVLVSPQDEEQVSA